MNTTLFPYVIPADSLDALHQAQQAAALLAYLGDQVNGMPHVNQIGNMAAVAGFIAERLNGVTDAVDAASTLPKSSGEDQADAR